MNNTEMINELNSIKQFLKKKQEYNEKLHLASEQVRKGEEVVKQVNQFSLLKTILLTILSTLLVGTPIAAVLSELASKSIVKDIIIISTWLIFAFLMLSGYLRQGAAGNKEWILLKKADRCAAAENLLHSYENEMGKIYDEYSDYVKNHTPQSSLHTRYWKQKCLSYLIRCFEEGRADTLKEALNLYELHADRVKEQELIEHQNDLLNSQLERINRRMDDIQLTQIFHEMDHHK